MALEDYTTYNDIRAALGVSDEELEDTTLALEVYSSGLEVELYDVESDVVALYQTIADKAEADRTDQESRVYKLVRLFSTYSAAKQLGSALPMFGPKSLSDGKASMSRFSTDPYKETVKGISEQYDLFRGRLIKALEDLSSSTVVVVDRVLFSSVGSAYDPVLGV